MKSGMKLGTKFNLNSDQIEVGLKSGQIEVCYEVRYEVGSD